MDVVVLLTPVLMYFHNTSQSNLPPNVAFVEVPYSQGPGFFANLMVYHELGHYVFEKLGGTDDRRPAFTTLLATMDRAFGEKFGDNIKTPGTRTWAKQVLEAWTEEVFCDLFALRNLGPAFSFALIDFLSLLGLMGEDVEGKFDEKHPAPALRLREQQRCLQKAGWWTSVENLPSGHVALMVRLGKSAPEYSLSSRTPLSPHLLKPSYPSFRLFTNWRRTSRRMAKLQQRTSPSTPKKSMSACCTVSYRRVS